MDAKHDPGTAEGFARSEATGLTRVPQLRAPAGARVRVGVASWTDPTMTAPGVFYPAGVSTAESRLRHYASRFPLVEVDSTYYAVPARRTAELWAERTPDDFMFDVKAHALMTGQPSEVARLPRELKAALPERLARKERIYASDMPVELVDAVWDSFLQAIAPLRDAHRLGAILMQYPRWFTPTREAARVLEDAHRRLADWPAAVEVRNRAWFDERLHDRTLNLLRRLELCHVAVDSPPGFDSSVPAVPAVTSTRLAIVRFHGRNTRTWESPVTQVSQRFRYLYDEAQLASWVPMIRSISEQVEEVHLVFNNCYGNYATTNALELTALLIGGGFARQT